MTSNITAIVTNVVAATTASTPWWSQYASEIIKSILIASLLGVGALFWTYIGHPRIQRWQKQKDIEKRKKEIEKSFASLEMSGGYGPGMGNFVSVKLRNNTNRPVIVRQVCLLPDGGGLLGLWHNTKSQVFRELTKQTETGIEITPHGSATWYFNGKIIGNTPLVVRHCRVDFEYDAGDGEIGLCEMHTPSERSEYINNAVRIWWDMVQKEHAEEKPSQ